MQCEQSGVDYNGHFGSPNASKPGSNSLSRDTYMGMTATATVTVAGTATGIQLSPASANLVANGSSTDVITATVVDANGNPVSNFNGQLTATLGASTTGAKLFDGLTPQLTETVNVVNGVAKITLQAPGAAYAGQSDTVTVSSLSGASITLNPVSTTVNYTAQVATAVSLTPTTNSVSVNGVTQDPVTVQVVDQAGQPMQTGTYSVSLAVAGAGTFDGGSTTPMNTVFIGGTTAPSVNVDSIIGQTGTITLTAASTGLTSASATVNAVTTGAATKVVVTSSNASLNADQVGVDTLLTTNAATTLTVTVEDANGNPVNYTGTLDLSEWVGTSSANNLGIASSTSGTTTLNFSNTSTQSVNVYGNATKTNDTAQTYTFKAQDAGQSLTAGTANFQVTSGSAAQVVLEGGSTAVTVPQSNTAATITAQVQDAEGNNVSAAGIPVVFTLLGANAAGTNSSDTATLAGISTTEGATTAVSATANTNASGVASVAFSGSQINGDKWSVGVSQANGQTVTVTPVGITIAEHTVNSVGLSFLNTGSSSYKNSTVSAQAGDTVTLTPSFKDVFGDAITPATDNINATFKNPAAFGTTASSTTSFMSVYPSTTASGTTSTAGVTYTNNSDGSITFSGQESLVAPFINSLFAQQAGTTSVTMVDTSVATQPSYTANFNIVPGAATTVAVFNASGTAITSSNELSVSADVSNTVTLRPVDTYGNATVSIGSANYLLSDGGFGGQFSTTSGGTAVQSVNVPTGVGAVTVYYQNATAGTYNLTTTLQALTHAVVVGSSLPQTVTANTSYTVTIQTQDGSNNAMGNQTVRVYFTPDATHTGASIVGGGSSATASGSYITLTTNAQGYVSFTYTSGIAGGPAAPDSVSVTETDGTTSLMSATPTGTY